MVGSGFYGYNPKLENVYQNMISFENTRILLTTGLVNWMLFFDHAFLKLSLPSISTATFVISLLLWRPARAVSAATLLALCPCLCYRRDLFVCATECRIFYDWWSCLFSFWFLRSSIIFPDHLFFFPSFKIEKAPAVSNPYRSLPAIIIKIPVGIAV